MLVGVIPDPQALGTRILVHEDFLMRKLTDRTPGID